MGYTTEFRGAFQFNKTLDEETKSLINGLASTRRVKRKGLDPKFGVDGEFYCNEDDHDSMVDYNTPPRSQPGLWLQWVVSGCGNYLEWDQQEKFYNYVEWLDYLIKRILEPRGYKLSGTVSYYGESRSDYGHISIMDNEVTVRRNVG